MTRNTILIVEDDPSLRNMMSEALQIEKYQVEATEDGDKALSVLRQNKNIVLVLSDMQLGSADGDGLLMSCRKLYPKLPLIIMTACGTIEDAVHTSHEGASDYLAKPFKSKTLVDMVKRFIPFDNDTPEINERLVAVDEKSVQMAEVAKRVALTDASVMISGESGVGKEVISKFIHEHSNRKTGPFIAINCAAIPENMLESELFGYEKGAFTGAYQSKTGKFEQAQGGTLLLDEITEMDLSLQAKLLRVLQEREVERLGGRKVISLDVRILATTNRNICQSVADGEFREDLFYRLNVFPIHITPLRERVDDIVPLAQKILIAHTISGEPVQFSDIAKKRLKQHTWSGNVRELDNVIQRALIMRTGNVIDEEDIHLENNVQSVSPIAYRYRQDNEKQADLSNDLKTHEQELIISALKAKNSRKEVAERLGISARTLRYKLAKMRDAGIALPA
jgi:two-component system response regulator FlrC